MNQQQLYLPPIDSHVMDAPEVKRLCGQNLRILERLRQGPATNRQLAALSLNYRARVSDLRAAGYCIPPPLENRTTGEAVYTLVRT